MGSRLFVLFVQLNSAAALVPAVISQLHLAVAPVPAAVALAAPLAPSASAALAAGAAAAAAAFAAGEATGSLSAEVARSAYVAAAEAAESSLRAAGGSLASATALAERAFDGVVMQSMLGNIGKMYDAHVHVVRAARWRGLVAGGGTYAALIAAGGISCEHSSRLGLSP